MNSGKFISDYLGTGTVEYQEILFTKLVEIGYEKEGKFLLATKRNGIPITILLLLFTESMDTIVQEINLLKSKEIETLEKLTSIMAHGKLKFHDNISETDKSFFENQSFTRKVVLKSNIIAASGTTTFDESIIFQPEIDPKTKLSDYFISEENKFQINYNYIEQIDDHTENEPIDIFNLYKHTIQFLELSYAIHERIAKYEIFNFNEYFNKNIPIPPIPDAYNVIIQNRGSIIHGNGLDIYFDGFSNDPLIFSNSNLENKIKSGYNSCLEWVNNTYQQMHQNI